MLTLERTLSELPIVEIARLVDEMRKMPPAKCSLVHRFTPGLYIRELFVPKGTRVVTKIHLVEHPFVVTQGKILVWSQDEGVRLIEAPFTGVTKPGTIRIAVALEDTVWTTFHATHETDPEKIEAAVVLDPTEALKLLESVEPKKLV